MVFVLACEDRQMTARITSGLSSEDVGVEAFVQAAEAAVSGVSESEVDLALVFCGAANVDALTEGLEAVKKRLRSASVIGCAASGVVGTCREIEDGGVAVWVASLPGARVQSFHAETSTTASAAVVTGIPDFSGADAVIMLADPYTFPIEAALEKIGTSHPTLPVVGGLASAGTSSQHATLICDGELVSGGAVGVGLFGADVHACVSQGAQPIGPEMVVTAAEENVIFELASQPALERLKEAISDLDESERILAAHGLLLGIVIDENQPDYGRGDFLVRGLVAIDEHSGSVTVGESVRVGQTVRMQVRDRDCADQDLRQALNGKLKELDEPPSGVLMFTCNGRGTHMFGHPDHDARLVDELFQGVPIAGFFCAGEIGPVGPRNFVHGFTATLAVFA
jgi:small ligand-binding sensory domain FIST